MVKPKNKTVAVDSDFSSEDHWIVVKKQRVNILIPCLPGSEPNTMISNGNDQIPSEKPLEAQIEDTNDVLPSFAPETTTQTLQESPPNDVMPIVKPRKSPLRKPINIDRVEALRPLHRKATSVVKLPETSIAHNSHTPFQQLGVYGACTLPSATGVLDKMMRARNLERKIARAGGMSRWLCSLRLEQFVTVFHLNKVSKLQLVNLSMQKLKEMGVHAVGPRRKLIHAIECLCEPCSLQGV